jgi:hypothetical protein
MAVWLAALCAGRHLPHEDSWYSFLLEAIVRLEELGELKNPLTSSGMDPDLTACSTVPQPTTLPRAPLYAN